MGFLHTINGLQMFTDPRKISSIYHPFEFVVIKNEAFGIIFAV
jgi:hypothetical protein